MVDVTVYIPCYNYGRYLDQAIKSVLSQTMHSWELILINDGSNDNTSEIISRYRNEKDIRAIDQENKGLAASCNVAIRMANGRYIMRLDADDYLNEHALLCLSTVLNENPNVGLVYPDYYIVDDDGNICCLVECLLARDNPPLGACVLYRKECLWELQGYDEEFSCQDGYDLWLRFIDRYNPYHLKLPLFYYRKHEGSLSSNQRVVLFERARIKRKYSASLPKLKVLGVIPVDKSPLAIKGPFVEIGGNPLLLYTLSSALQSQGLDKIIVDSSDIRVLEFAAKYAAKMDYSSKLWISERKHEHKYIHLLVREILERFSETYDAVMLLYITSPLRTFYHIDKAIDTMRIFNFDSVISVREILSFCYSRGRDGLIPLHGKERMIRQERKAIYAENGLIYLSKSRVFESGNLLGNRIGYIVNTPEESIKIDNEYDYKMAELLLTQRKI